MTITNEEITQRMAAAAHTADQGRYREAAHLYQQLGKEIQAAHGRFSPRALDAYEAMARAISASAAADG